MDRELEALDRARGHADEIARLAEKAREHLADGRLEDAEACFRLIVAGAGLGKEALGPLLNR